MRVLFVLLTCVTSALCQERPAIHVNVNLVNVAFTVRDTHGGLATGLTRDDFEVFEDGVAQKIEFFARSGDVPLALGLIFDFSGSQEHFLKRHHHDLLQFLDDVLGQQDRAFLVGFGNHLRLLSDFSPSPGQLVERLTSFEHGNRHFPELGPLDEERELGTAFYDAIYYSVTEKLAGVSEGRRTLVVFSDGEDNSSAHHMMDAIEAAQAENVPVFSIRYTETNHGRLTARNKYGIRVMERIGRETGGADFDAEQEDLGTWFRQIGEELRSSYELAYTPANWVRDGSFRKITVRAKRPELAVRSRTGYFARPVP